MTRFTTTKTILATLGFSWVLITILISLFADDLRGLIQAQFTSFDWPHKYILVALIISFISILFLLISVFFMLEKLRELKVRNSELSQQLNTDNRSGLSSYDFLKASFHDDYIPEIQRGTKFSVLMVDIVDFKIINDTLGHDIGDGVISLFGGFLKSFVRGRSDLAARYGEAADEFFFIISGDISALRGFTNRLQRELLHERFDQFVSEELIDLKIEFWSSGTAANDGDKWDDILKRLTKGLIEAKSTKSKELIVK